MVLAQDDGKRQSCKEMKSAIEEGSNQNSWRMFNLIQPEIFSCRCVDMFAYSAVSRKLKLSEVISGYFIT